MLKKIVNLLNTYMFVYSSMQMFDEVEFQAISTLTCQF